MAPTLQSLGTPSPTRPKNQSGSLFPNIIRAQFSIQTWLAFGAALQALLFLLPIRRSYAVLPVFLYLALKTIRTGLTAMGVLPNDLMSGVIMNKYSAVIPPQKGGFSGARDPAKDKICVLLLGTSSNHPLGPLAPGVKDLGDHFLAMTKDLESRADETGYLGHSFWYEESDRHTKASNINIFYFRSVDDVHRFAEGPIHRRGWDWFSKSHKKYPHIGIFHEVYEAPAGKWETVYVQQRPVGLGKTQHKIIDEDGKEQWVSSLVDARRGRLSTTYTRMGMKEAEDV